MNLGVLSPRIDSAIDLVAPINWLHPLNSGLRSWWLCLPGMTGGRQWPDLCNRTPGVLSTMDPVTRWEPHHGRLNGWGALDFDSAATNKVIPTAPVDAGGVDIGFTTGGPYTWAAWERITNKSTNRTIVSNFTGIGTFSSVSSSDVSATLDDGNWHHVAATVSSGLAVLFYVDGKVTGGGGTLTAGHDLRSIFRYTTGGLLQILGGTITDKGPLWIGGSAHAVNHWLGLLDDVRYYNRKLEAAEVEALYRESKRGYPGCLRRVRRVGWLSEVAAAAVTRRDLLLLGAGA